MRIAYLDCASGISGDMVLGALIDVGIDVAAIQAGIDSLGLPSCRLAVSQVSKCGFRAAQVVVEHEPEHVHRHLADIVALIDQSRLSASQRELAVRIFERLAEAEAEVHGTSVDRVHFHEVGAVDSIADIVGAAIGWDLLGVDQVVCSPIPTGSGTIQIAHGRVSVPAPATAELLRGVPLAPSAVVGELTTPTGAAIVTTLTTTYGTLPAMTIEQIGYSAGSADFEHPNILRLLVGQSPHTRHGGVRPPPATETICVLETNVDDAAGEFLGHCADRLWAAGALDVVLAPIQMKKGRPAVALTVQCRPDDAGALETMIFSETTTLGIRRSLVERRVLARESCQVETMWGTAHGMRVTLPDGEIRFTPAYESCRAIAEKNGLSLPIVYAAVRQAGSDLVGPQASVGD